MTIQRTPITIEMISPYFSWAAEGFTISGKYVKEIMGHAGSNSAYIYDANTIRHHYQELREALPSRIEIYYAMKANPSMAIVQLLTQAGTGVDIASYGELLVCKKLGIDPGKIAFTAPVKNNHELIRAVETGVYINAESHEEVIALGEISNLLARQLSIGLRINPPFHIDCTRMHLSGGGKSKFGIDLQQVPHVYARAEDYPNLQITGIHLSIASGVISADALLNYYAACFRTADELSALFSIERIDMGGGLGIPFLPGEKPLNIATLGTGLQQILDSFPALSKAKIILEPGRFLVGRSGIYVCRIQHVKASYGQDMLMVDGGAHQLSGPAMRGSYNPTYNLSRRGSVQKYDIAGETCTAAGYLGKQLPITRPEPGDFLGVFNAGGYGYTQSLTNFISHGVPPEILIDADQIHTIREAKSADSHIKGQHLPHQ